MARFVKKWIGGYTDVPEGQSDPNCTHVILELEEYEQLLKEIKDAERETAKVKRAGETALRKLKNETDDKIWEAQEAARKTVEENTKELVLAQREMAYQKDLNKNLLRVAKERANADRKLTPKKEHTGYLVVSSGEKETSYKDGNRNLKKKVLWETVIQSPYSVDFTEQQVRRQITEELLRRNEEGIRLIDQIGIDGLYSKGYGSLLYDRDFCQEPERYNIMLKPKFRENFRAGYWEVIFFHTKPLGIVPKNMRIN